MRIRQTLKRAAAAGATILAATTIYLAGAHAPAALAQSDPATPTPSPTAVQPPSTTGIGISIMNPNPEGGYYAEGDVIKFKVPMSPGTRLRPIVVNEAVSAGTYFQFRYTDNTGHPAYLAPQKANLAAIVDQAGKPQYLIYEHTVATVVSTNADGTLYYATGGNRDLYKVHDSVCGPTADNCLKLTFTQPAGTDLAISGTVRVAAGGSYDYTGRNASERPQTDVTKVSLVNPPADGVYTIGDTVRLQAEYDRRLQPVARGTATGGDSMQIRVTNRNEALPDSEEVLTFRTAPLAAVHNAGDHGYAEYAYTVLDKDQDANGIQVISFTKSAGQTKLCPEVIGTGCDKNATVENSAGRYLLENVKLNGKGIGWSDVRRLTSLDLVMGQSTTATAAAAAVPTPSGSQFIRPIYYKVANLPPGMEITQSGDAISIGGTPTQSGTFATVITAIDGTGQEATHTVNITVTTPDAPTFSAARNDLVVYQDDSGQGNQKGDSSNVLTLPAVSGGTQPITYSLHSIALGQTPSPDTCPDPNSRALPTSWITQPTASGANQPGTVSVKSGSYRTLPSVNLVLKATDASDRTACWHFSASVAQRATLGAPRLVGNEARYFTGDKIAFDVPVANGPVTVAQGDGKVQPQLQIQIGNTSTSTRNRTATYVNAGGGETDPHTGSTLRFEYTLNEDTAYASEDFGDGHGIVKAIGMTQRENVKDANGHIVGGNPGNANLLGAQQRIDADTRPEFKAATYAYTKWRDETFAVKLPDAFSSLARLYRVKHGANALPATAPADASNAPYGLHFNPGTRTLSWPDNQPATGDNLSATLTYEVYLKARTMGQEGDAFFYNYPEYVADTATVTVTRKERPVPTRIELVAFHKKVDAGQGVGGQHSGGERIAKGATIQPGDHVGVRVIYDAPVAFATDTTERPTFNLTVGNVTRRVTLDTIATRNSKANISAEGSYTFVAADQGAIGVPNTYLNDQHLLVGASAAPAAKQGNAVRPSLTSDTNTANSDVGATVQSGGPAFSVRSDHTVTLYGTVDASVVLPEATSPTGKDLTYTLRQDYSNSPNLGSTAEATTGLKFDAATRTLSRDKGEVIAAVVSPTTYILTATETDGKSVSLEIGVNVLNQPEATNVRAHFTTGPKEDETLGGDMATGNTLYINVNFNKNVKIDSTKPAPQVSLQIGDHVREVQLHHVTNAEGDRINLPQLRGSYVATTADHDHDGIALTRDWLVNPESVVGTDPEHKPEVGTGYATYENPVRYASVSSLHKYTIPITVHADFGWPDSLTKPELTIVANREYRSSADNLGNILPAANAGRNASGIGYRATVLPSGLANTLHVGADKRPRLVGMHTDTDRSEHGVTADYTVTANAVGKQPVDSATLTFSIRIISDVLLDGTSNTYKTGDKIRVIVNHNAVVDFTDATDQPALTLSIGGTARTAAYNAAASNPASGKHVFEYTVVAADSNTNGTCAVTGMTNDGGIAPTIPDSGITLANCHVNRAGPSFASNAAEETVYVARERGGYAPVTYALINQDDNDLSLTGRTDLTLTANDDGSHGVTIPAITVQSSESINLNQESAQHSKLVATDALGQKATYKFTVTTVGNVPAAWAAAVSSAPTERNFFRANDEIVVTVTYGSDQRIGVAAPTAEKPGAYVEITVGDTVRKAYAKTQTARAGKTHESSQVKFGYTIQAGDADSNGITVGNTIHDCQGLTGHYTDAGPGAVNGLSKPLAAAMHQMVDGCPIPAVATPSTTPVQTTRDASLDLDHDGDGLIEIRNVNQLIAMSLDPNGNGVPMELGEDYKANSDFDDVFGPDPRPYAYIKYDGTVERKDGQPVPLQDDDGNDIRLHEKIYYAAFPRPTDAPSQPDGTTNGCPDSRCTGYELASDIDLRQVMGALRTNDKERRDKGITGRDFYENLLAHGMGSYLVPWQTTLEGNGFVIRNLSIGHADANGVGFLADISPEGTVQNVGFANASTAGDSSVGIIAGVNYGTITNVFVNSGNVTAHSSNAGLIVGQNGPYHGDPNATISKFWATGTVSTPDGEGAIAGVNYGVISEGWSDGFTVDGLPVTYGLRDENVVTGYTLNGGQVSQTREIHSREAASDQPYAAYLITEANLKAATAASQSPYAAGALSADDWDFGDNCQRPVLKGGHTVAKQSTAQGNACSQ